MANLHNQNSKEFNLKRTTLKLVILNQNLKNILPVFFFFFEGITTVFFLLLTKNNYFIDFQGVGRQKLCNLIKDFQQ